MSTTTRVGRPITLTAGVPRGLEARRVETVVTEADGTQRVRTDRRRRRNVKEVALVATDPDDLEAIIAEFGHRTIRGALGATSRRRTGPKGRAPDRLGVALARAGLVALRCQVRVSGDGLRADPWTRWIRMPRGEETLNSYQTEDVTLDDLLVDYATEQADRAGTTRWRDAFDRACDDALAAADAAVRLTTSGRSDGWPLSMFARHVTGSTHGLDDDSPLTRVVVCALVEQHGNPDVDRAQIWADAGLGVDVLASAVTCVGLPPGRRGGPAAAMLAAGFADGMPIQIPRVRLVGDPAPVAPPPPGSTGWVFAVENEALLSWTWRRRLGVPVTWHGSDAAFRLLEACQRAGWRVAVSADFEQGGLKRAASLLDRLDSAVPWRLSADDYLRNLERGSGAPLTSAAVHTPWEPQLADELAARRVRVTEEDRFDELVMDLQTGQPGR